MTAGTRAKRLLAINFGGLGDEVLFLPTLQTIKAAHPEWHITLLTEPRGRSICDVTNVVDDNLTFDIKKRPLKPADYAQLLNLVRGGKFDAVVSSGSSPMVAGLLFLSGARTRVGFGTNGLAKTLLTNPVPLVRNQHATLMYHSLVKGLGLQVAAPRPEVTCPPENIATMRAALDASASGVAANASAVGGGAGGAARAITKRILLHPGTSQLALDKGIIKTWAPEQWADLVRRLLANPSIQVILAGGPDDKDTIAAISAALGELASNPHFFNAYGKTGSLKDLVALLEIADAVVCVDSAPMHLAVGLGKPMVALFGPTDPAKLLWHDPRFVPLRDMEEAAVVGDRDPFTSGYKSTGFVRVPVEDVILELQKLKAL